MKEFILNAFYDLIIMFATAGALTAFVGACMLWAGLLMGMI